jgi:hypothetical protein
VSFNKGNKMKQVKVVGKLFWAKHMTEPNKEFNESNTKYEICIGGLSESIVQRLSGELGIKIKERTDDKYGRGKYIVAKSNYVIKAVDEDGNEVSPDLIGNGSVAECTLSSYTHKLSNVHGNGVSILHSQAYPALKIKELVAPPVNTEEEAEVSL